MFLANDGKPYMAEQLHNSFQGDVIWIYTLHPDNKWVTIKQIPPTDGHLVLDNLTAYEQSLYPKFEEKASD